MKMRTCNSCKYADRNRAWDNPCKMCRNYDMWEGDKNARTEGFGLLMWAVIAVSAVIGFIMWKIWGTFTL